MKLLSVSMPHHDVNMCYQDGLNVRYIKLERIKQEKRFSFASLLDWKREAEKLWNIDPREIDDTVFTFDPGALPATLRHHLPQEALIRLLSDQSKAEILPPPICEYLGVKSGWMVSHHYSHALSTWMLETQRPDVQIVIDGLGDGRPWSVYKQEKMIAVGHIKNGSIGWGIREAGKLLDIKYGHYNDIAGKVMGLQSYGKVDQGYFEYLNRFGFENIRDVWSVEHWYAYKKDILIGKLTHLDWIATVHLKMGEMLVDFFKHFANKDDTISYSGGVAQNVIWNSVLSEYFSNLVIPPHSSDEGLSLGGLEWLRKKHGLPASQIQGFPFAQSDTSVVSPSDQTINAAVQLLSQGKVIGWYQGNGEIGPRALGHRSILMDPRLKHGKNLLNKVKKREHYRPFGASVLRERFEDHFAGPADDFMLYTSRVKAGDFPAITHVDNTCRIQLVDDRTPAFHRLLVKFFETTTCPVLSNTSLNLAGKPIAAFPENAMQLFYDSEIDAMVIGDDIYRK